MIQVAGLITSFLILAAYARTEFTGSPIFTWANAMLWPVIVAAAVAGGAWGPAVLSAGFGGVAIVKLLRPAWVRHEERWAGKTKPYEETGWAS